MRNSTPNRRHEACSLSKVKVCYVLSLEPNEEAQQPVNAVPSCTHTHTHAHALLTQPLQKLQH
uniref:Uncharacterized protein n=1 Tax=Anguilla anguilla TaxID=7936 RepID=A0A0E9PN02_ANGAN